MPRASRWTGKGTAVTQRLSTGTTASLSFSSNWTWFARAGWPRNRPEYQRPESHRLTMAIPIHTLTPSSSEKENHKEKHHAKARKGGHIQGESANPHRPAA